MFKGVKRICFPHVEKIPPLWYSHLSVMSCTHTHAHAHTHAHTHAHPQSFHSNLFISHPSSEPQNPRHSLSFVSPPLSYFTLNLIIPFLSFILFVWKMQRSEGNLFMFKYLCSKNQLDQLRNKKCSYILLLFFYLTLPSNKQTILFLFWKTK